jgi:uncharacterized protein involved in exopolysaccharide biosynthesis
MSNSDNKNLTDLNTDKGFILMIYDYFSVLRSKFRWFLLILALLILLVVVKYLFFNPIQYVASQTFTINDGGDKFNNFMSLASKFGVDAGSTSDGEISTDIVTDLLHCNSILSKSLLDVSNNKQYLINEVLDSLNWRKAMAKKLKITPDFKFQHFSLATMTRTEMAVLKWLNMKLDKTIEVKVAKSNLIQCNVTTTNEWFSKNFCESLVQNLSIMYISKKTEQSRAVYNLVQTRVDSIQKTLCYNEEIYALNADKTKITTKFTGTVEQRKVQRDVVLLNVLYSEAIKNLELVKFNLANETPVFQVIDRPMYPLEEKKSELIILLIFAVISSFILFNFLVYFSFIKNIVSSAISSSAN